MGLSLPRATECDGRGTEEGLPSLTRKGPLGAILGPPLRTGYSGSAQQVAKGHLPTQNQGLFHSEDKSSRFEPQHIGCSLRTWASYRTSWSWFPRLYIGANIYATQTCWGNALRQPLRSSRHKADAWQALDMC